MAKRKAAHGLDERARAIIKDASQYDEDTRAALNRSLESKSEDLREDVRRAERGETICDTTILAAQARGVMTNEVDRMARTLSFRDLEAVAARLSLAVSQSQEEMRDLLLLMCAAAYSTNPPLAEHLYIEVRNNLMPYIQGANDAADAFVCEAVGRAHRR